MFGRPKKERFNLQEHNETIFLMLLKIYGWSLIRKFRLIFMT